MTTDSSLASVDGEASVLVLVDISPSWRSPLDRLEGRRDRIDKRRNRPDGVAMNSTGHYVHDPVTPADSEVDKPRPS